MTEHAHAWEPAADLSSYSRSGYRCACGAVAARKYNRRKGFGPIEVQDGTELGRRASDEEATTTKRARQRNRADVETTRRVIERAGTRHVEDLYKGKG